MSAASRSGGQRMGRSRARTPFFPVCALCASRRPQKAQGGNQGGSLWAPESGERASGKDGGYESDKGLDCSYSALIS